MVVKLTLRKTIHKRLREANLVWRVAACLGRIVLEFC